MKNYMDQSPLTYSVRIMAELSEVCQLFVIIGISPTKLPNRLFELFRLAQRIILAVHLASHSVMFMCEFRLTYLGLHEKQLSLD